VYKTAAREVYNIKRVFIESGSQFRCIFFINFIPRSADGLIFNSGISLRMTDAGLRTRSVRFSINPALGLASRRFHAPVILKALALSNSYLSWGMKCCVNGVGTTADGSFYSRTPVLHRASLDIKRLPVLSSTNCGFCVLLWRVSAGTAACSAGFTFTH
jgi:hypothetical protein